MIKTIIIALALCITAPVIHANDTDTQPTPEQIDAWCAAMIEQQHLTDSVVYICLITRGTYNNEYTDKPDIRPMDSRRHRAW